uniref:Ctr_U_1 conopeptide n=1 Tax=Conus tribblei TaxID=101761 RepID=A0A0K8TUH0_CONTD
MNRMGFFLMLTAAVLLTSLICTEAAPADEAKLERAQQSSNERNRNPEKRCADCRPGYQCCGVCTINQCTGQEIPKE